MANAEIDKFRKMTQVARFSRRLHLLDMEMQLSSNNETLLRYMADALVAWGFPGDAAPPAKISYTCFIGCSSDAPSWVTEQKGRLVREETTEEWGATKLYEHSGEHAIYIDDFGHIMKCGEYGLDCFVIDKVESLNVDINMINALGWASEIITADLLSRRGYMLVHAGGTAVDGKCRLWTGAGGAGKTTKVLQRVSGGEDFCGDDLVVLRKSAEGAWLVEPYKKTVNVTPDTCLRLSELSSLADSKPALDGCKQEVDIHTLFPTVKVPKASILESVHCFVKDSNQSDSGASPLSVREGVEHIAPWFLHYLWPEYAPVAMDSMMDIASSVPIYTTGRSG